MRQNIADAKKRKKKSGDYPDLVKVVEVDKVDIKNGSVDHNLSGTDNNNRIE